MRRRGDYQLPLPIDLSSESPGAPLTHSHATPRSDREVARIVHGSQNGACSSVTSLRPAAPSADAAACGQPINVRVTPILAAVQTTQTPVLPFQGMANAIGFCAEGAALVFEEQETQINATCAPYQAPIQPSVAGAGQIEYQRDMFKMSQGGA